MTAQFEHQQAGWEGQPPKKMPQYHLQEYWEERYCNTPGLFDWYQGYSGLATILQRHAAKSDTILQVGCGTSRLAQEMVEHGFQKVINVDYAANVVELMRKLTVGVQGLEWIVADARDMREHFSDGSIDVVIDKGTMDALMCGDHALVNSVALLGEVHRCLKPGGRLIIVTYGAPDTRIMYFDEEALWGSVQVYCITKVESGEQTMIRGPFRSHEDDVLSSLSILDGVHYAYVLTKPGCQEAGMASSSEEPAAGGSSSDDLTTSS